LAAEVAKLWIRPTRIIDTDMAVDAEVPLAALPFLTPLRIKDVIWVFRLAIALIIVKSTILTPQTIGRRRAN